MKNWMRKIETEGVYLKRPNHTGTRVKNIRYNSSAHFYPAMSSDHVLFANIFWLVIKTENISHMLHWNSGHGNLSIDKIIMWFLQLCYFMLFLKLIHCFRAYKNNTNWELIWNWSHSQLGNSLSINKIYTYILSLSWAEKIWFNFLALWASCRALHGHDEDNSG